MSGYTLYIQNHVFIIIMITGSLDDRIRGFELRFKDLVVAIQKELTKEMEVSVEDLLTDIILLPSAIKRNHLTFLKENISNLNKASNLREIFMYFNLYWDYFNYTLLEVIIKDYGSENLKKQMGSYISDLHQFWQKTTVADFIPYCKKMQKFENIPKKFIRLEVKDVIKSISEYTLMELEELKHYLCQSCQLPYFCLILYDLGCAEVTWLVAKEVEKQLMENEAQKIVSISVGGECIKEVSI